MLDGRILNQTKKRIVCFIEKSQLEQIEQIAKKEGVSKSSVIRKKLEQNG